MWSAFPTNLHHQGGILNEEQEALGLFDSFRHLSIVLWWLSEGLAQGGAENMKNFERLAIAILAIAIMFRFRSITESPISTEWLPRFLFSADVVVSLLTLGGLALVLWFDISIVRFVRRAFVRRTNKQCRDAHNKLWDQD